MSISRLVLFTSCTCPIIIWENLGWFLGDPGHAYSVVVHTMNHADGSWFVQRLIMSSGAWLQVEYSLHPIKICTNVKIIAKICSTQTRNCMR